MFDRYRYSKGLITLTLAAACLSTAVTGARAQQPTTRGAEPGAV